MVLFLLSTESMKVQAETLGSTIRLEDTGLELDDNIERGSCPYTWVVVDGSSCPVLYPTGGLYSIMYDLRYFSSGNNFTKEYYQSSNGCGGNKNLSEHDDFLENFEATLNNARNSGTSLILRFSYANDNTVGNEPATFKDGDSTAYHNTELIRTHIKELSKVINRNKDVVLAVECGMFGPWGEMHSSMYDIDPCNHYDPKYSNSIISRWLDKLDPEIKVLVRAPKHLIGYYGYAYSTHDSNGNTIYDADIDDFNSDVQNGSLNINQRLGMYNDGYLGSYSDVGTFGSDNDWPDITREDGVNLLEKMTAVPYGGEFAYVEASSLQPNGSLIYNTPALMSELYRTHLSYLHNINNQDHVISNALNHVDVSTSDLVSGLDSSEVSTYIGHSFRRFIRDHMGYRLLVKSSYLSSTAKKGGSFNISGSIKNLGFGNFLTQKYTEVILKKGSTTYVASVDSFNANEITSLTTKDYDWTFSVPSSISSGNYDVYLRIRNERNTDEASVKTGIRFANPDAFDETLRANKIGTIKISGTSSQGHSDFEELN